MYRQKIFGSAVSLTPNEKVGFIQKFPVVDILTGTYYNSHGTT